MVVCVRTCIMHTPYVPAHVSLHRRPCLGPPPTSLASPCRILLQRCLSSNTATLGCAVSGSSGVLAALTGARFSRSWGLLTESACHTTTGGHDAMFVQKKGAKGSSNKNSTPKQFPDNQKQPRDRRKF